MSSATVTSEEEEAQRRGADGEEGALGRGRRDEHRAGRDGLRPQVRGDLPAPRPHLVGHVVDRPTQRLDSGAVVPLRRGDHPHEIDLLARPLGPEIALGRCLELGGERGGIGAEIEDLGSRPLLRLPHLDGFAPDDFGDRRRRIVQIAGDDRLLRADDHARGLEPDLDPVRAVVALGRRPGVRVDVERVVGARLHARLAADAPGAVEVHDAVGAAIERDGRADGHARRRVAVIAPKDGEVAPRVREGSALDVLHPGAERPERDPVLLLAGDRAGVASDASALIDHEPVAHALSSSPARGSESHPTRPAPRRARS